MLDDFSALDDPTDFSALHQAELAEEAAQRLAQFKQQLELEIDPDDFLHVLDLEDDAFSAFKDKVTKFGIASLKTEYKIAKIREQAFRIVLPFPKNADSVEVVYYFEFYRVEDSSENHIHVFKKERTVTYFLTDRRSAVIYEESVGDKSAFTILEMFDRVELSE